MKQLVTLLALAALVATTAEAATTASKSTTTASKSTTTTKSTTSSNAAQTSSRSSVKSTKSSAPKSESYSDGGPNLGLRAIGGSLGFTNPQDIEAALSFGVFADMGRITNNIKLEPRMDYWSKSEGAFGAEASIRDLSVGARAKYLFETSNPKIQPFAGVGLGMHFLKAEVTVPGFPDMSTSDTKLGLDFGGGVSTPVGMRSAFIGELWYSMVSDFDQFSMRAGLSYNLK